MEKAKKEDFQIVYSLRKPATATERFVIFSDASLANLNDGFSSGAGFIIFIMYGSVIHAVFWRSYKIRRVVKSTIAAETLALVDGIDNGIFFSRMFEEITGEKFDIDCFVDHKSLCDNLHSTKAVEEKRLRLDIASIRQYLSERVVRSVNCLPNDRQIAVWFTKRGASSEKLISVLGSGCLITSEL